MKIYSIKNGKKGLSNALLFSDNDAVRSKLYLQPFPFLESILYIASLYPLFRDSIRSTKKNFLGIFSGILNLRLIFVAQGGGTPIGERPGVGGYLGRCRLFEKSSLHKLLIAQADGNNVSQGPVGVESLVQSRLYCSISTNDIGSYA